MEQLDDGIKLGHLYTLKSHDYLSHVCRGIKTDAVVVWV